MSTYIISRDAGLLTDLQGWSSQFSVLGSELLKLSKRGVIFCSDKMQYVRFICAINLLYNIVFQHISVATVRRSIIRQVF